MGFDAIRHCKGRTNPTDLARKILGCLPDVFMVLQNRSHRNERKASPNPKPGSEGLGFDYDPHLGCFDVLPDGAEMLTEPCTHDTFEKIDAVLPDGFSYCYYQCPLCGTVEYPLKQAQKLLDYSKEHIFMFVEDWIIAWIAIGADSGQAPASEIATVQKQMLVLTSEFAPRHDIPTENPGFRACGPGPCAQRVDRALQTLDEAGLVTFERKNSTGQELICLTESGRKHGKALLSKLDADAVSDLETLKTDHRQSPI